MPNKKVTLPGSPEIKKVLSNVALVSVAYSHKNLKAATKRASKHLHRGKRRKIFGK